MTSRSTAFQAIVAVLEEKPNQYMKVIAGLVSRETTVNVTDDRAELSDDELVQRLRALTENVALYFPARPAIDRVPCVRERPEIRRAFGQYRAGRGTRAAQGSSPPNIFG